MATAGHRHANATLTMQHACIDGVITTNNTPLKFAVIPIPANKTYQIEVFMMAIKSDNLTRNVGTITGLFWRGAGNISQEGTLTNALTGILSTTKVTFVINNTSHEVELYANGLLATIINWNFGLDINYLN